MLCEELLKYVNTINKEVTRKREEFDLETLDYIGQKLSEKRLSQVYELISNGTITIEQGVYATAKDGSQEIVIQDVVYTISDDLIKTNAAVFDTLKENLGKAADVNDRISEERQRQILVDAVAAIEAIAAKSTLSAEDQSGLNKAIELMNDAIKALDSYQLKR